MPKSSLTNIKSFTDLDELKKSIPDGNGNSSIALLCLSNGCLECWSFCRKCKWMKGGHTTKSHSGKKRNPEVQKVMQDCKMHNHTVAINKEKNDRMEQQLKESIRAADERGKTRRANGGKAAASGKVTTATVGVGNLLTSTKQQRILHEKNVLQEEVNNLYHKLASVRLQLSKEKKEHENTKQQNAILFRLLQDAKKDRHRLQVSEQSLSLGQSFSLGQFSCSFPLDDSEENAQLLEKETPVVDASAPGDATLPDNEAASPHEKDTAHIGVTVPNDDSVEKKDGNANALMKKFQELNISTTTNNKSGVGSKVASSSSTSTSNATTSSKRSITSSAAPSSESNSNVSSANTKIPISITTSSAIQNDEFDAEKATLGGRTSSFSSANNNTSSNNSSVGADGLPASASARHTRSHITHKMKKTETDDHMPEELVGSGDLLSPKANTKNKKNVGHNLRSSSIDDLEASFASETPLDMSAKIEQRDALASGGDRKRSSVRKVGRPLSYAEPSTKQKLRQGDVHFVKTMRTES